MSEIAPFKNENVIEFIRRRGAATTQDLQNRFALDRHQVDELIEGLEENGHIKLAWVLCDQWNGIPT